MSKATPAEPSSLTTRPQYGSSPLREHCTSIESATLRAAWWAAASLSAPTTRTCETLVAPSASSTICSARDTQTSDSAAVSAPSDGLEPAPLAMTRTVSLVEVQPSTVMELNETPTAACSAACSVCVSTAASVVHNANMVAMLGASMAAPLAIPPMLN